MIDKTLLDNIIIGRVEPHIYAFTTNTVPNYLKVGDTYRSVEIRLQEWREHYPELQKQYEHTARISGDVYFRDYAVHQFLEGNKRKARLLPADIAQGIYYSREFFKDTVVEDVQEAIRDIERDYNEKTNTYQFYNAESRLPETFTFARVDNYPLRPNQEKTVEAFRVARVRGRKNLLMYAVMRFGKSFTSMCCAVDMGAKLVVVVSAKADVRREWKQTVESHVKFADYDFLTSQNLSDNNHIVTEKFALGRRVVVFLTLQDLQGNIIKDKHQEIFGQKIDLLLVDETHFGARADKYGAVLKPVNYQADVKNKNDDDDFVEVEEADEVIKVLNTDITIHLSGTPYRILMGSEFKKEDIIAFYQFADIVSDKEKWDKEHILNDDFKEWDNPYYGFPQMVRFAFNPNESSRRRLDALRNAGTTYAFSALFKPKSIKKNNNKLHKQFEYENEVLELLEVIDGSKADSNLLGFLDYDKIKAGQMCRHIVIVLPYCASCDALEALINNNKDKFKNLKEYEIINISGVDNSNAYKTPDDIKTAIRKCEEKGKKTITLTVNRMLTGSTVPEWDTMLYLKDTSSPQEYDQAIFRLQNQYIKTYVDDNGDTIKFNMKPQTLLVDFMPNRMFVMQETKSKIYNANVETSGNSELESRIEKELCISPIVTINADKIVEVKATDILRVVSNYQKDKGIREEALEIPVDLSILNDEVIRSVIERENEIGSKAGISTSAHVSKDGRQGDDLDVPDGTEDETNSTPSSTTQPTTENEKRKLENILKKKIQSFYVRILLFSYITKNTVISLSDIIDKYDIKENRRIAKNLGLDKNILLRLKQKIDKFVLSDLDYKIQDLNELSRSTEMPPEERASVAVNKFGKLGDAIVITPSNICDEMIGLLSDDFLRDVANRGGRILDIAGTAGEYAIAIYKKLSTLGIDKSKIAKSIYTIPKSSVCYELIRKLYEMIGLNVDNIASEFVATDLLDVRTGDAIDYGKIKALLNQNKTFSKILLTDDISQGDISNMISFDAIVGNPPYQEIVGNSNSNKALGKQLFPNFIVLASKLSKISSLITPSKWFTGNGQDGSFPKLREYVRLNNHFKTIVNHLHNDIFPEISIGSLSYYLYDEDYVGDVEFVEAQNGNKRSVVRPLFEDEMDNILSMNIMHSFIEKVCKRNDFTPITTITTARNPFKVPDSNDRLNRVIQKEKDNEHCIKIYCAYGETFYLSSSTKLKNDELISKWKIFISKMNGGAGTIFEGKQVNIIGESYIGEPSSVCSGALISIGQFETKTEAYNLQTYLKTKFCRFMIGLMKSSQALYQIVYQYVPMQDFKDNTLWSRSISKIDQAACKKYSCETINEIDAQLYSKYNLTTEEVQFIESIIKPME